MKKLILVAVIFIGLVIFIGILKNPLIKQVATISVSKVVGAPVKIDSFSLSFLKQKAQIRGFKIYNPRGFPEGILLDLSEVLVDVDVGALFKSKLHLEKVVFDLKEVSIVVNKEGKLNVDALKVSQKTEKPEVKSEEKQKKPQAGMPLQIDELVLTIGKLVYKDYSAGSNPSIQAYEVGIKEKVYKNITSSQQLVVLILSEPMKSAGIKGAGIYGAATILGLGFLPAGVAGVLVGKDSSEAEFNLDYDRVYTTSIEVMRKMGSLSSENKATGVIKGNIQSANVTLKITRKDEKTIQATASARKYLIPKPEIAGGLIYAISEKLK